MAGTMSALASSGLHRGAVHHSIGTCRATDTPVASSTSVFLPAVHCFWESRVSKEAASTSEALRNVACGLCLSLTLATALPSFATQNSQVRLPPLSTDPNRCEKAFVGNTIGQANGVADKQLDLRMCDFSNDVTNLKGKSLSAALMSAAKFDGADMTEVIMSKAYAVGSSFKGTIFRNAVIDRVTFDNSEMQGVQFINTVLSGSTFEGANLEGSSFEDALIGYVDIQKLCRNETLPEEARLELACKQPGLTAKKAR